MVVTTVMMTVTEQVVPNTTDHSEGIAILMEDAQPQIVKCPVPMPWVMVLEVVPEAD